MSSMERSSNPDAAEAVRLACRLHGHKQGWHFAAAALGVSERTARALAYGETSGATICPYRAHDARMAFRRERAAQIRAELASLETTPHGNILEGAGAAVWGAGGSFLRRVGLVQPPCAPVVA